MLLAISFMLQVHDTDDDDDDDDHHCRLLSTPVRLAVQVPTVLILTGIIGTGAAIVVGTLATSLGTAVAMSGFLILGVVWCLLALIRYLGKVSNRDQRQQN